MHSLGVLSADFQAIPNLRQVKVVQNRVLKMNGLYKVYFSPGRGGGTLTVLLLGPGKGGGTLTVLLLGPGKGGGTLTVLLLGPGKGGGNLAVLLLGPGKGGTPVVVIFGSSIDIGGGTKCAAFS